jgi:hypothetical protein
VAAAVLDLQDRDMLDDLQRQHRVVFGQDEQGLLYAVTDRARIAMNWEQSDHVRELMGQPDAMPTLDVARRMASWLEREHGIRETVTLGLEQSISAQDDGQAFLQTLGKNDLELRRDHGERLYVIDGKTRIQLDNIVTTEQQAESLHLLAEQYREIPVFDSALDRQERFEQRMEDIQAARLQRLIARDVDNVREFVAESATDIADHAGQALEMVTDIAGSFIGGFARLSENAMEFFSDFFTGGSAPATRPPVQRVALQPTRESSDAKSIPGQARRQSLETPSLDPHTEAIRRVAPQALSPEKEANIQRLLASQARARQRDNERDDGRER